MPSRASSSLLDRACLVASCPDQPGIIAAVSRFLFEHGANIVHSDQHSTGPVGGRFFLRVEFDLPAITSQLAEIEGKFSVIAERYNMAWHISLASVRKRLAIFVSREPHCLLELLWQQQAGDLNADISVIVSNHDSLRSIADGWRVPFHVVVSDQRTIREARQEKIARDAGVDLIVLARYMQVLSPEFVARWPQRIINIHHSFLPAFVGSRPYQQAHARGVKLIGATAHYVTAELDGGPIIEQDTERVDHRHSVEDLRRIGRQIERTVLARAVAWHVTDRVLVDGGKTVVFR